MFCFEDEIRSQDEIIAKISKEKKHQEEVRHHKNLFQT